MLFIKMGAVKITVVRGAVEYEVNTGCTRLELPGASHTRTAPHLSPRRSSRHHRSTGCTLAHTSASWR